MKLAKLFWSLGSLLINVVIIIYVNLMRKSPRDIDEWFAHVNDNWDAFGMHWKAEYLLMTMITIGAFYFATQTRKISWSLITIGLFILLTTYPIMIGGFRNTPVDLAEMANQIATIIFVFGNLVFFSGLFILYLQDTSLKKWLRIVAIVLSAFMALVFTIVFAGFLTWGQTLIVAPLANVLYLINAYYGLKIDPDPAP